MPLADRRAGEVLRSSYQARLRLLRSPCETRLCLARRSHAFGKAKKRGLRSSPNSALAFGRRQAHDADLPPALAPNCKPHVEAQFAAGCWRALSVSQISRVEGCRWQSSDGAAGQEYQGRGERYGAPMPAHKARMGHGQPHQAHLRFAAPMRRHRRR